MLLSDYRLFHRVDSELQALQALQDADPQAPIPSLLERTPSGVYPADPRPIGPAPTGKGVHGVAVEFHDGYWEVRRYAQEWSTNCMMVGRGPTLVEAWAALDDDQ